MLVESKSLQILGKDPRTVAGGGGVELELAKQLSEFGKKETGLDQYAIAKYAEALEVCQPFLDHVLTIRSICEIALQKFRNTPNTVPCLRCCCRAKK